MAEKVTIMRLKVDLHCEKCYKKVKKVLCKFPQIRDQVFDEKQNIVTIKVVCCSPEKIRDKLCCKACGAIKSIEIVEPPKPKPPEPPKPKPPPKPDEPEKPKPPPPKPAEPEKPKPPPPPPKPDEPEKPKPPPPKPQEPCPKPTPVPTGVCCVPCYEGRPGGPCFEGYGGPPPCYGGCYYGRPVYDSYGGGRPCYCVSRCDQYFNEDNATGCTIM
ncbi:leucine-rich repeat extensin-like protein 3 isoform X3 [Neltuma alba]|uniref:leucine-rich repeat extensin-like protein 3 isoform X3 n=1 Tax=Neltuma alba TaxID=207710 RepID=UPI0010A371AD|nr:leucine-rich repeat extensin-like protein 3 isoform X3 [Prosopis alba]